MRVDRVRAHPEPGHKLEVRSTRTTDARTGAPIPSAPLLAKTSVNHSIRLYAGFKHDFNEEVTLSTGLEYIQSVSDAPHHWINYDALFAETSPAPVKYAASLLGRCTAEVRQPLWAILPETQQRVQQAMRGAGLLN